jgi:glutamate-ammonia-ligase adenylyltransferase
LLVTSLDAFARYHEQGAQGGESSRADAPVGARAATWERMALLRARAAAGDPVLGAAAMRIAEATAYEGGGDPRVIAEEVNRLRHRMQRELAHERPGRYDMKHGRGGLVDIEFTVQWLQLCHGERAAIRTQETALAIEALAAERILSPAHAHALRQGYAFLRRLEQRTRIVHADATHLLEENAPGLVTLARRMGIRDRPRAEAAAELIAHYRDVTDLVRGVYEAIVVAEAERAAG